MTRTLTVWWEGAVVGSLALDADGQMQFTYAEEWLAADGSPALSCSLPNIGSRFAIAGVDLLRGPAP